MTNDGFDHTSVCEIVVDGYGEKWLNRLADIDVSKDELIEFDFNEDLPPYYDNRDRLFLQNGPNNIGTIGVWHWSATPNDKDPQRDYISTKYDSDLSPTEVVRIRDIDSIDALITTLKDDGIKSIDSGIETIYCIRTSEHEYKGLLCEDSNFNNDAGKKTLKPELNTLPLIEFSKDEIIETRGHAFLRSLQQPTEKANQLIKSPFEIVKNIVVKRCSWSTMKAAGFSRNVHGDLINFINELPDKDLYEEISNTCGCSIEEAKSYTDEFLKDINKYLNNEDIEFSIVDDALESHDALKEKYRSLIKQEWESKNSSEIEKGRKQLDNISKQLEDRKKALNEINEEIKSRESDREELNKRIEENQKLADEVAASVEKKIEEAKKHAADFIAEMAFAHSLNSNSQKNEKSSDYSLPSSFEIIEGNDLSTNGVEKVNNLIDSSGILAYELQEAGVSEEYCPFLSSLLISAWNAHIPLLIAGPNSIAISDALSVSLKCKKANRIQCDGHYSKAAIDEIYKLNGISVIENIFSGDWIDHIHNIFPNSQSFYIFTNPFAEDLLIEPHSLYNYMFPVLTEPFIKEDPTCNFYGGILNDKYSVPQPNSNFSLKGYNQFFSDIGCGGFMLSRISKLITAVSAYPSYIPDWDYYVLLAYSYLTDAKEALLEQVDNDSRASNDCKNLIKQFIRC